MLTSTNLQQYWQPGGHESVNRNSEVYISIVSIERDYVLITKEIVMGPPSETVTQQRSAHPHTGASVHIHLSSRHLGDYLVSSGDIAVTKSDNRAFIYKCLLTLMMMMMMMTIGEWRWCSDHADILISWWVSCFVEVDLHVVAVGPDLELVEENYIRGLSLNTKERCIVKYFISRASD